MFLAASITSIYPTPPLSHSPNTPSPRPETTTDLSRRKPSSICARLPIGASFHRPIPIPNAAGARARMEARLAPLTPLCSSGQTSGSSTRQLYRSVIIVRSAVSPRIAGTPLRRQSGSRTRIRRGSSRTSTLNYTPSTSITSQPRRRPRRR